MCTSNSDCTGGSQCINGKCSNGVPPKDPPVPPLAELEDSIDQENDEVD